MTISTQNSLAEADLALLQEAEEATNQSYVPYSNFRVGAAFLLQNGAIIKGCNVENASYPLCLCAEQVGMSTAHMLHPEQPIVALAVTARSEENPVSKPVTPCGGCRQILAEAVRRHGRDFKIILGGETETVLIYDSIEELLPLAFGADFLGKNPTKNLPESD